MQLSRRHALKMAAAGGFLGVPGLSFAHAATAKRFVFLIQRGAADGLNIVIPHADPAYAKLRGGLTIDRAAAIPLDGMFALHPSLAAAGRMFAQGEAAFVHAIASPYRERSHFDAQNMLETGGQTPFSLKDGWLNRLAALLPDTAEPLALAPVVPLALRGKAAVISYAPSALPDAGDDLRARLSRLYAGDAQLHGLWEAAVDAHALARESASPAAANPGALAARFLKAADGPRIAVMETGGWDTHSAQAGRLAGQLARLDRLLAALKEGLGPVWQDTLVLVATEFGRTAAVNGTGGTDHGTGAAAMLLGGMVRGGRVIADWPGLAPHTLREGRDLQPTASLNALILGLMAAMYGIDPARLQQALFPGDAGLRPMEGLLRT